VHTVICWNLKKINEEIKEVKGYLFPGHLDPQVPDIFLGGTNLKADRIKAGC
jgi:hypothetical protein